eukprot:m.14732 g.14732  ORF g.14732 m.14732 type:complete len:418 (+) comp5193_c0_seq1:204-1457(+)
MLQVSVLFLGFVAFQISISESVEVKQQIQHPSFEEFVSLFNKTYSSLEEYAKRRENYENHIQKSQQLTTLQSQPGNTATFGATQFADWSNDEFQSYLKAAPHGTMNTLKTSTGSVYTTTPVFPYNCSFLRDMDLTTPGVVTDGVPAWDWRDYDILTGIKNQGDCGGCWAFAATETVESSWAMAGHDSLGDLSVQQILDCESESGGCCGGAIDSAMRYIWTQSNKSLGIERAKDFPFKCYTQGCGKCQSGCNLGPNSKIKTFATIYQTGSCSGSEGFVNKEDSLAAAIRWAGPMAVTIDAFPLKGYTGGIIRHHCPNTQENHAVQIVGYGSELIDGETIPYWIVRNSWGTTWGENGYFRLYRGENACGIASDISYTVVQPPSGKTRCEGLKGTCSSSCAAESTMDFGLCSQGMVCCTA